MAIRDESETPVVIDMDQWSSGSLCTLQQGTFTHVCMQYADAYISMQLYTIYILGFGLHCLDLADCLLDSWTAKEITLKQVQGGAKLYMHFRNVVI